MNIIVHEGNFPIIISVPHGGYDSIEGVAVRKSGCLEPDFFTQELAGEVIRSFSETKFRPYMVVGKVERKFCDLNRPATTAFEDEKAAPYHSAYHSTITDFIGKVKKLSAEKHNGMCLLVDLHGQSTIRDKNLRGTRNTSTVTHMVKKYGNDSLVGEHSFLGHLNNNGFAVFPTTAEEKEHPEFNGGFTVANYGSKDFVDKVVWIDAIQIETGIEFRKDEESRAKLAKGLRDAILAFYEHYIVNSPRENLN